MSLFAKTAQWAPVILATGTTIGLFAIHIDDPKTKKIIRSIAFLLGIGTAFSLITQVPAVVTAIDDGIQAVAKLMGLDDESRLARLKKDAEIQAAKAKAEADRLAYERQKEQDRIAHERQVADQKRALEASIERAKADAERAKADAEIARITAARQAREAEDARKRAALEAAERQRNREAAAKQAETDRQIAILRAQGCKTFTSDYINGGMRCDDPHAADVRWGSRR